MIRNAIQDLSSVKCWRCVGSEPRMCDLFRFVRRLHHWAVLYCAVYMFYIVGRSRTQRMIVHSNISHSDNVDKNFLFLFRSEIFQTPNNGEFSNWNRFFFPLISLLWFYCFPILFCCIFVSIFFFFSCTCNDRASFQYSVKNNWHRCKNQKKNKNMDYQLMIWINTIHIIPFVLYSSLFVNIFYLYN